MSASRRGMVVGVSFSEIVRHYSFFPYAPHSGEHNTIPERSTATLVTTFATSLNFGLP